VCGAFLAGSLVVAGTNVVLVRSEVGASSPAGRRLVVAVMPRMTGDPYSVSCRAGAEEAARELGIQLIWEGSTSLDSTGQVQTIETWIMRRVDAVAVATADRAALSPVLRKARARGIPVVTWDSDAEPDARDLFVNPADSGETGGILADQVARSLDGKGEFAILAGSHGSRDHWVESIRNRVAEKYPGLKLAAIRPGGDDRDEAFLEARGALKVLPAVRLIVALSPPAVPGAAEAVLQSRRPGVKVIGLSLPAACQRYIGEGVVPALVLWNGRDLGYLTVQAAALLAQHQLTAGADFLTAGRLGRREICGGEVVLNPPELFEKEALDKPLPCCSF
jgi:rhamnose transport system permease protein